MFNVIHDIIITNYIIDFDLMIFNILFTAVDEYVEYSPDCLTSFSVCTRAVQRRGDDGDGCATLTSNVNEQEIPPSWTYIFLKKVLSW